jgi:hypothetical protein
MLLLTAELWPQTAPPASDEAAQLRQEIDQLKKTVNALEQRLNAQAGAAASTASQSAPLKEEAASADELQTSVRDLNDRVLATERRSLKRIVWTGEGIIALKHTPFGATFPPTMTACNCRI